MLPRRARGTRQTTETAVHIELDLDGKGRATTDTGIPFLDHMLDTLATHAVLDLTVNCDGDLEVDPHHTVEDVAIALGNAITAALDDRETITRYGDKHVPLDEALAHAVLDISNRPYYTLNGNFSQPYINDIPTHLFAHFFRSLAMSAGLTLHLEIDGDNAHHEVEALFKAFARTLDEATRHDTRRETPPTTKGEF